MLTKKKKRIEKEESLSNDLICYLFVHQSASPRFVTKMLIIINLASQIYHYYYYFLV